MCVPGCQEAVRSALSRRRMLKGASALAVCLPANSNVRAQARARHFTNAVDLTHTLSADFPTFFGVPGIEMQKRFEVGRDGFKLYGGRILGRGGARVGAGGRGGGGGA